MFLSHLIGKGIRDMVIEAETNAVLDFWESMVDKIAPATGIPHKFFVLGTRFKEGDDMHRLFGNPKGKDEN